MQRERQIRTLRRLLDLRKQGKDQHMLDGPVRIPVSTYTARDVFDREMETAFRDFPIVAGHVDLVRAPGQYLLSDWPRLPFVVVRNEDGRLRAFLNQCRHRGAPLVSGCEDHPLRAFVCRYHGWTYGLDGELRTVPKAENFPGLDRSAHGLVELPVTEKFGLVWVHPTPRGRLDIEDYLGPFGDDLRHFGIDELRSFRRNSVIKQANWKLLIKTYLEGYHVPFLHRGTLSKAFRRGVIAYDLHDPHLRLAAARTNILDAENLDEADWRILDFASVYYSFFPNTFFIMHPDYVSVNTFYPLAPDKTVWVHDMLYQADHFGGQKGTVELEKRFDFTNDVVFDNEDFAVAEQSQQQLTFGANDFHTLGMEEGLLAVFQRNIDDVTHLTSVTSQAGA